MKYLKTYQLFESVLPVRNQSYDYLINDCKDILLELFDKGINYNIYGHSLSNDNHYLIRIDIGDQHKTIQLIGMDLMFEHLFAYMESEGFKLHKDSFYQHDTWDYYESCPNCGGESIKLPDDLKSMMGWKCNKCGHEGHQDDFQRPEHPLDKADLFWAISQNYYIQSMSLAFYK
jgi:hypothetical protein